MNKINDKKKNSYEDDYSIMKESFIPKNEFTTIRERNKVLVIIFKY
jgi:hypothetical protein